MNLNPPARNIPTVGRIVHFHLGGTKSPTDPGRGNFRTAVEGDTYAAMVAAVAFDGLYLNLTVSDFYGNTFSRTMIPFVQPGDERPAGAWCEWPPIQNSGRVLSPAAVPTLNTPVRDPQKLAEAIDMNVAGKIAPDAPPLVGRPDKERAALERNTGDIRRIQDAVRHPVIAAAQQLYNDGRPKSSHLTMEEERRLISLFSRSDSLDYSTLTCSCGQSFRWHGGDDRLNPWLVEHEPHMKQLDNYGRSKSYQTTPGTIDGPCINCNQPYRAHVRDTNTYVDMCPAIDKPGTGPFDSPAQAAPHIPQD